MAGPLVSWAVLLRYTLARAPRLRAVTLLSAAAWLATSFPVRYTVTVLGWDPSGHVLVIGVQLVPLIILASRHDWAKGRLAPSLLVAMAVGVPLAWISLNTAAFFHTASEVAAAWAAVAALYLGAEALLRLHSDPKVWLQVAWWALVGGIGLAGLGVLGVLFGPAKVHWLQFVGYLVHDVVVAGLAWRAANGKVPEWLSQQKAMPYD